MMALMTEAHTAAACSAIHCNRQAASAFDKLCFLQVRLGVQLFGKLGVQLFGSEHAAAAVAGIKNDVEGS
jgi:hypothetical protein